MGHLLPPCRRSSQQMPAQMSPPFGLEIGKEDFVTVLLDCFTSRCPGNLKGSSALPVTLERTHGPETRPPEGLTLPATWSRGPGIAEIPNNPIFSRSFLWLNAWLLLNSWDNLLLSQWLSCWQGLFSLLSLSTSVLFLNYRASMCVFMYKITAHLLSTCWKNYNCLSNPFLPPGHNAREQKCEKKDRETRKGSFSIIDVYTLKEHMFASTGLDSNVSSPNYPVLGPHSVFERCGLHVMELSWLVGLPS